VGSSADGDGGAAQRGAGLTVGVVAGEPSGDLLGAGLVRELRARIPGVRVEGIGGPAMAAQGCRLLYPMEDISLMGFEGIVRKGPRILAIRRRIITHFGQNPPDVFVGIDAPDFNLPVEERLRAGGVPTVHYVSPTVWAWRGYRIGRIRRAVDRMLTLFPFEADYYREHGVPVRCVGHPMADQIPVIVDAAPARQALGLPADGRIVTLLPGSRASELRRHAALFVDSAIWLRAHYPDLTFTAAFVDEVSRDSFRQALDRCADPRLPLHTYVGRSREAIAAADVVLLKSGTAALEAALVNRPMVVTYRVNWLSYPLLRLLMRARWISMPNNLAGREVVPELVQGRATPSALGRAVGRYLDDPLAVTALHEEFARIHRALRLGADVQAAEAVLATARAAA